jgi:hypothetical protein
MAIRREPRSASSTESMAEPSGSADGAGLARPVVNLALQARFTDAQGVVWRRRGDAVTEKRVRTLMNDSTVRVLHDYMGRVQEVPGDQRTAFAESAQQKMRESPYSDFVAAEFKNQQHEHLLVLREYC